MPNGTSARTAPSGMKRGFANPGEIRAPLLSLLKKRQVEPAAHRFLAFGSVGFRLGFSRLFVLTRLGPRKPRLVQAWALRQTPPLFGLP